MAATRKRVSLAGQYARTLALLFIAVELMTAAVALVFIFLPMAERAADDLAGLMVLSAQTWAELPPEVRPLFEKELAHNHQIALRPEMAPPPDTGLRHGFYIRFLEHAFEHRLGRDTFFLSETAADGGEWLWTMIPVAGHSIGAGFARSRMQTQPLGAVALAVAFGALLVGALAVWLARRIAAPVAALERAAERLAQGARPKLLPESGPRELADLARHFNRMAEQVRELSDARTTLFAGISHDLRTPLARMRLALEMLTLRPDPALIQRLERDIEEMTTLIAQLLDIARGLSTEPAQEIDLCPWLKQRAQTHEEAAASAGASLTVRCNEQLRARVATSMLARVLDNLLGNALRYAPGPIDLVAEQRPASSDAPAMLRIGVLDRGPGIAEDQRTAVLRPFHRLERSRSPTTGGFGLGLAIVRQLAHANGWRVQLAGREGGGLEAWIEVPASA